MKKICITSQILLLIWFFLDMTGVYFGDKCLVARSYKEDWIFFLIYLIAFVLFIVKDKIGKWIIAVWTSLWFATQFLCHEWYTIFDGGFMGSLDGKIEYFSETIQWISIEGKYIPDIYHTILHILIFFVILTAFIFIKKSKSEGNIIAYNRRAMSPAS